MPEDTGFARPTLNELITRVESDFNTRLPGADSRLRHSVLSVLSRTQAGSVHSLYGYLDFIARQAMIDTAEIEYLERHGAIWGISRKPSTKAIGTITVTGQDGAAVNIGTRLRRGDGTIYLTTEAKTIVSGEAVLAVEAENPGESGNALALTKLNFVNPISGLDVEASSSLLAGGAEPESDESLKTRIIARIQQPPAGGSENDYLTWAKEVAGVTRAWSVGNQLGAGSVAVRFMMDDTYSDGIPQSGDVAILQEYIDARRPITADVTVVAPVPSVLNFTILLKKQDGSAETSPIVRAAVEAELKDMILRDGYPGVQVKLSRIREAISVAAGEYDHQITVPSSDVSHGAGNIPVFGSITWLSS